MVFPSFVQSLDVLSACRSVDGTREQEGVSDNVPLPPPTMPSATGTGERDGEGDGSVDGDGRLVPQLMVDKDGKIVVNENRCVCVCVCVCACVRACVRACMHECLCATCGVC